MHLLCLADAYARRCAVHLEQNAQVDTPYVSFIVIDEAGLGHLVARFDMKLLVDFSGESALNHCGSKFHLRRIDVPSHTDRKFVVQPDLAPGGLSL
jgi:hypothetical protein